MDPLEAVGSADGRYRKQVEKLAEIFSEKGLIKYRTFVEGEYLTALASQGLKGLRALSDEEVKTVRNLSENMSLEDAKVVKEIETKGHKDIKATNHDVKAVEYFMKDKLKGTSLDDVLEFVHFALTSEDTNNLAYALMLSDGVGNVILPSIQGLHHTIHDLADKNRKVPMLARTHGQPASPTTFGKEFEVYASRIERQIEQLSNFEILAKLNGATGNYNAHHAAYPGTDWLGFTKQFIQNFNEGRKIKLNPNFVTTQIEPHDTCAELFDNVRRLNTILIDFNQDIWRYVSDGWIKQKPVDGEVGSSTMPHKINPILFENSEGNLGYANAMLEFFSRKLPVSRLQRDLSDSTVERNFGTALAHSLIGYESTKKGLSRIAVDEQKVREELDAHPEVITEAIQTILRREGVKNPYELLKDLSRGKKLTMWEVGQFIDKLSVPEQIKQELRQIHPSNYLGLADKI